MDCYRKNSYPGKKGMLEIKVVNCKEKINHIDKLLGNIYGLSEKEIEYIINYDKEMKN